MASTDTAITTAAGADLQEPPSATSGCTSRGMGAYEDARRADHRPRRRRLRLGRERQPLSRRALGALLRQRRPRPHGARRGRRRAGRGARLLHALELRAPAGDRARGADRAPSRPPTSTASSSPPAARRPSSRRSSSRAPTTSAPATRGRPSSSPARSPTTAPPWARCGHRHHGAPRTSSSRWCPAGSRCRTPTATTGPRTATRSGPPTRSRRRSSSRAPRRSPP